MPPFARLVFSLPMDRAFQYESGGLALQLGDLVVAPFGHRRKPAIGCVVGIDNALDPGLEPSKVRSLLRHATPGYRLSEEQRVLGRWIATHYACSWGEALSSISLVGFNDVGRQSERWLSLANPEEEIPKSARRQQVVAEYLRETDNLPRTATFLAGACEVSSATIDAMIRAGRLRVEHRPPNRPDPYEQPAEPDTPPTLNPEQREAVDQIDRALSDGKSETFLLHGITGSGKTEVYLHALAKCIESNRQGIVLVPEIALTPQTVGRFRARFGARVGVVHSRLTLGQKLTLWRRIEAGEIDVVIGARSAVFAPLPRVGLIVIDEEHEGTYKQGSPAPRYHARDVGIVRAQRLGAVVILGSATPSMESQANVDRGKFTLLTLAKRIGIAELPKVQLVNMCDEIIDETNPTPISSRLRAALIERLERGEQSVILLNRRGFAPFMLCPSCRHVVRCDHCDVAMTWHRSRGLLVCHWCEATRRPPKMCPDCSESELMPIGVGTQRIEEELQREFPLARTLRIDLDTTRGKDAFLHHWKKIKGGEVDIILGTQMIAKGLDLPGVTLVGVISADQTLFLPDFRSAERAFQLMTQVAGRAGRGDRPGEVLIQTYVPHHYALRFALNHDFHGFFKKEMRVRQVLRYPPAQRLAAMLFTGEDELTVAKAAKRMGDICRTAMHLDQCEGMTVVGPGPAPMARLNDRWRWRLLLRSSSAKVLHGAIALSVEEYGKPAAPRGVQLTVDVDPMDLL